MSTIALVTGASSGLGREFVRQIDAGGAGRVDEIWAVARRGERLDAIVRTTETPVRPFCLDLTDAMSFDILEAALAEEDADVALLVNCAGTGAIGSFADIDPAASARMMVLHMRAPVELIYRALPHMRAGSRIINVSSVAAFVPQPGLAVYSAAKRFLLDLSRSLDAELGEVGIHVCAVCPKFMATEILSDPGDPGLLARLRAAVGDERVEDVARAALAASRAGRGLCIPSLDMRALYAASRVVPYPAAIALERAMGII